MKITFLGSGTSHGIPVINCNCECCISKNPKDTRWRCSIKVETEGGACVIVDVGPEFRLQALKYGLPHLDAVFLTHSHADHLHGLDDVRIFAHTATKNSKKTEEPLKIFSNENTLKDIKFRFDYVFKSTQQGGGKPLVKLIDCSAFNENNPIIIKDLQIIPVPMLHGNLKTTGWIFTQTSSIDIKDSSLNLKNSTSSSCSVNSCKKNINSFAYLTDCNFIPPSSVELVKNCSHVCIDALREKCHPTHLNFEQAVDYISKMNGFHFYLTHISHESCDDEIMKIIQELKVKNGLGDEKQIQTAFDGLEVFINRMSFPC